MTTNLVLTVLTITLFGGCSVTHKGSDPKANVNAPTEQLAQRQPIEGAYEFVSETTVLEQPEKKTDQRTSSDWAGLWIFHGGYFSRTLMKKERAFTTLAPESIGYESDAGTYKIEDDSVTLYPNVRLYPIVPYPTTQFKFKAEGNKLVLTRTFFPYMEDLSAGNQTIVLNRNQ
jgi:hypothetical protein